MGIEIAFSIGYLTFFAGSLTCMDIFGMILMGLSVASLLFVSWPRTYLPVAIDPRDHEDYFTMTEKELLEHSISDAQHALDEKYKIAGCKASLYEAALILLMFSALFLILTI